MCGISGLFDNKNLASFLYRQNSGKKFIFKKKTNKFK
tara:strand:+ start:423 stop:533 length:111 start_codon:yes stop_codon:yes gene_type:complete